MNNSVKLNINLTPSIKTYTYHCFFHSIISAPDKVNTDVAEVYVKDFEDYIWEQQADRLKLKYNNEKKTLSFEAEKWNLGMNHCFWRECNDDDSIEIEIISQLFSSSWGAINIFVTNETQDDMLNDDAYIYRFGNFCKEGLYVKYDNNFIQMWNLGQCGNKHLLIRKKGNTCQAVILDGASELVLHTGVINSNEKLRIGFEVKLNDNVFYEWFFSNYIDFKMYPGPREISMDFLFNNEKNWNTYQSNYFLDYNIVYRKWISEKSDTLSVLNHVKAGLDRGLYVEMYLNENYYDGLDKEGRKPHIHQNLVYGYDDDKKVLNVLNVTDGYPKEKEMLYEDFLREDNFSDRLDEIVFTHYNPDYTHYKLDTQYLIHIMEKYLASEDIDMELRHLSAPKGFLWGISGLEFMLTKEGEQYLVQDIRISYLLRERADCMMQRLSYLQAKGILSEEEKTYISIGAEKAKNHIEVICYLVLIRKNKHKKGIEYDVTDRVVKQFKQYIQCEKEYISIFIRILKSKRMGNAIC